MEVATLELTALTGVSGQADSPERRAPEATHAAEDTLVVSPESETLEAAEDIAGVGITTEETMLVTSPERALVETAGVSGQAVWPDKRAPPEGTHAGEDTLVVSPELAPVEAVGTELSLSADAGTLGLEPTGTIVLLPSVVTVLQAYAAPDTSVV